MVIAVPCENNMITDHFGRTQQFMIYEIEGTEIVSSQEAKTDGRGHFYMVQFLTGFHTAVVISKGMGEPSRKALEIAGIRVILTDEDTADGAVRKYIAG